jgi:ubiquinone/menaquinone biosynthesis C-methylase UbiE
VTQNAYVHGGTDAREVARLEKQAAFISPQTFPTLGLRDGHRVLDLATGVGAMASRLRAQFPGIHLVGIDLSRTQLAAARANHPELTVLRGDATRLPFADETFDRVHCSWLLEHVPDPVAVLRDVRRVLKRDGSAHFIEVQNTSFGMEPKSESVFEALRLLNAAQVKGGGDPDVGRRLEGLFSAAGFARVQVDRPLLRGADENAAFRQQFIDEFSEIFEGLDESLGAQHVALLTRAAADLRALPAVKGALWYTPAIATGWGDR